MGTIYAIANQKGGVGKTTTAVNVAACIAEAGYATLLVDIDAQANATVGLGVAKDRTPNVYDVLGGTAAAEEALVETDIPNLALLPAHPDLAGASMELPRQPGSETRLRDAIAPMRDRFAFTLLDCPPSLGPLTVNALVAAERVIVPVQTEYFALEGLAGLLDTLSLIQRELNPRLTVAGMLLTMHDNRTKLGQDVEREVRQHFPELVFDTVIPRNIRLGEAPSFGRPVIHHDPHCAGSEGRMRDALTRLRGAYAFTLLDCPPSLGPLTVNALVAADRVIVPVQTEYFALEGLAGLLDTLGLIQRELNPRLTIAGMLLTMHDGRTKLAQDVEAEVRRHFPQLVFDTVIPRNVRLGEAPSYGRPVIHHDPHCAGADAYFELAKEVAQRG